MHVETYGPAGAPPVLLLHGGGVAGWMWEPVRERLSRDHRLIVPDLPGHDRSAGEPYHSHGRTVEALIRVLGEQGGRVRVAGFSLGAQLAVLLAAEAPELVERVMVVSAQARPSAAPGLTLGLLGATAGLAGREWFARAQAKALFVPDELLGDYVRTSAAVSKQTLLAAVGENIRFTVPPGWARFPRAALVLAGGRERRVMLASARLLHEALPGSGLEIVEGAGHGIPLQRPAWFAERVRAWLA
ncbi:MULTISPECIES: alpha/beta hydrolase [Nonomuraea]|uniref:alpha/beta fold hydrolase n=1 Tax=Nonomuraea TaxID=83681 RepID=UPI001C5EE9DD|nr:alpha/beta hydrolase [Nonomuraea ceibae]